MTTRGEFWRNQRTRGATAADRGVQKKKHEYIHKWRCNFTKLKT